MNSCLVSWTFYATIAALTICSVKSLDLTLEDGASGEMVVIACIQKIEATRGIFTNDYGFLKRIALVESNFGENQTVISGNPTGGIWQISQSIYQQLSESNIARIIAEDSSFTLGEASVDLTDSAFNIPMRSAFAARLFIDIIRNNNPVPTTLEDQALWWSTHYNPNGNRNYFIETVERFESMSQCGVRKLDLWYLLDGSGSIGLDHFQVSLNFVQQTAAAFIISPEEVRTGLMIYSSTNSLSSRFDQHTSNSEFAEAVRTVEYPGGGTNTGAAIREVNAQGFNVANGARPRSEGVPRILIVLTDGESGDDVTLPSEAIKDAGVLVYAVGVGRRYNRAEINEIASESQFAFEVERFNELVAVLRNNIESQSCRVPVAVQDEGNVMVAVPPGETQYARVEFPANGSVELSFSVENSDADGTVYISSLVPNPGPAIYDITFPLSQGTVDVIINDGEEGLSLGPSSITKRRSKRNVENEDSTTKSIFIAVTSTQNSSLSLNLTSTGKETPSSITTPAPPSTVELSTTPEETTIEQTTTPEPTTTPMTTTSVITSFTTTPESTTMPKETTDLEVASTIETTETYEFLKTATAEPVVDTTNYVSVESETFFETTSKTTELHTVQNQEDNPKTTESSGNKISLSFFVLSQAMLLTLYAVLHY